MLGLLYSLPIWLLPCSSRHLSSHNSFVGLFLIESEFSQSYWLLDYYSNNRFYVLGSETICCSASYCRRFCPLSFRYGLVQTRVLRSICLICRFFGNYCWKKRFQSWLIVVFVILLCNFLMLKIHSTDSRSEVNFSVLLGETAMFLIFCWQRATNWTSRPLISTSQSKISHFTMYIYL